MSYSFESAVEPKAHDTGWCNISPEFGQVHLPSSLNTAVCLERENLLNVVAGTFASNEEQKRFSEDMAAFERRADALKLEPQQVAETYKQLEKMLSAGPFSPFKPIQIKAIAGEWMDCLAGPASGNNLSFAANPEKTTARLAQVVTTGHLSVPDAAKSHWMGLHGGHADRLPTRIVKLNLNGVEPSVDRIVRVIDANIKWNAASI